MSTKRAEWVKAHYLLKKTSGGYEAIALGTDGQVVGRFAGPDYSGVRSLARRHWGHFNHHDEAEAFGEIFPARF